MAEAVKRKEVRIKMDKTKAQAVIEAVLFTMGESVEISRLADVIEEDVKTTKSILEEMAADYEKEDRGISLTYFDNAVQLCTKAEMYEYLIKALMDTFTLIPVNGAVFHTELLIDALIRFMSDYIIIGFRICLPIFCVILLLNCVLGILAKIAPQMNMFSVGIQLKVLTGLSIMFLTVRMLPGAADFIFREMKELINVFVGGMTG